MKNKAKQEKKRRVQREKLGEGNNILYVELMSELKSVLRKKAEIS